MKIIWLCKSNTVQQKKQVMRSVINQQGEHFRHTQEREVSEENCLLLCLQKKNVYWYAKNGTVSFHNQRNQGCKRESNLKR